MKKIYFNTQQYYTQIGQILNNSISNLYIPLLVLVIRHITTSMWRNEHAFKHVRFLSCIYHYKDCYPQQLNFYIENTM